MVTKPSTPLEALTELVACKDLQERMEELGEFSENTHGAEYRLVKAEYRQRQPLAWANAREIVSRSTPLSGEVGALRAELPTVIEMAMLGDKEPLIRFARLAIEAAERLAAPAVQPVAQHDYVPFIMYARREQYHLFHCAFPIGMTIAHPDLAKCIADLSPALAYLMDANKVTPERFDEMYRTTETPLYASVQQPPREPSEAMIDAVRKYYGKHSTMVEDAGELWVVMWDAHQTPKESSNG